MKKIISLFQRNYETDHLVRDELTPGAEWVINGEGVATRKFDGRCCMIETGILFKRYDAKNGKTPPDGFSPAQEPDLITGHWPGWLRIGDGPEDWIFRESYDNTVEMPDDGTYECVGPKVNGNKDDFKVHTLIAHGECPVSDVPTTFNGLKEWFKDHNIEGIVWHHPDGRMVKIKRKDFGLKW